MSNRWNAWPGELPPVDVGFENLTVDVEIKLEGSEEITEGFYDYKDEVWRVWSEAETYYNTLGDGSLQWRYKQEEGC